jgi:CBS domain containing-hemolysin-like protein
MFSEILVDSAVFLCSLVLSAFFSAAEVALFSLQPSTLEEHASARSGGWKYVATLLRKPRYLLVTILIGNTVVTTAAAVVVALLTIDAAGTFGWNKGLALGIEVVVVTFVVIVLSEVTPKVIAARVPAALSRRIAFPLYCVSIAFYPLTAVLVAMVEAFESRLGLHQRHTALKSDEIKTLADVVSDHGAIDQEERSILHSMMNAKEIIVREVMTPRTDMVALDSAAQSFDGIVDIFVAKKHSRIPVYSDTIDNIKGILYAKDVLPLLYEKQARKTLDILKLSREPLFVPESKKVEDLLKEFQDKKTRIAIVVDEYGGTAGLVTFQNVVGTIVGDISDELAVSESKALKLSEHSYRFSANIGIADASEILGVPLFNDESGYDTLGGFLFHLFGRVPKERESIQYENIFFTVQRAARNRILYVLADIQRPAERKETE